MARDKHNYLLPTAVGCHYAEACAVFGFYVALRPRRRDDLLGSGKGESHFRCLNSRESTEYASLRGRYISIWFNGRGSGALSVSQPPITSSGRSTDPEIGDSIATRIDEH